MKTKLNFRPKTFELLPVRVIDGNLRINIAIIYRPPPFPTAPFFDEFNTLADILENLPGENIILGDFNCPSLQNSIDHRLSSILSDRSYIQHISEPTRGNNLLDLLISFSTSSPSTNVSNSQSQPSFIQAVQLHSMPFSDHAMITFVLQFPRPTAKTKTFTYRNLRNVDTSYFQQLIRNSRIFTNPPSEVDEYASQLDSDISAALDIVAPSITKTKRVSARPTPKWMTGDILSSRRTTRQLERRYRRTGSELDFAAWKKAGRANVKAVNSARTRYLKESVEKASSNPSRRWNSLRNLLHSNSTNSLPNIFSAQSFCDYFIAKLSDICATISASLASASMFIIPPHPVPSSFSSFAPVTSLEAANLIRSLTKSSPLDIIPVSLIKSCCPIFSTLLSELANRSFVQGKFPSLYKTAQITPLIKKPTLDPSDLASYRPISNLRTMGKLLESLAQSRLRPHINSSPSFSPFQSAYRPGHSTETGNLKIANDLFGAISSGYPSLLVSLDLSAAFDCVLHSKLLDRLSLEFGFSGSSLSWIQSYLTHRKQFVKLGDDKSTLCTMTSGVPQGSVLGPLLFSAYLSPVSRLIQSFGLLHHIYADDITLLLSFDPKLSPLKLLNDCTCALSNWLMFNGLRLNPTKSEVLWTGTRQQVLSAAAHEPNLVIADLPVTSSQSVKITGVTFDNQLSFSDHISDVCKGVNYHLRALSHIRRFLDTSSANLLAVSIIGSRIDYCNSLFSGISDFNMLRLQRLQNRAAHIVTNANRTTPSNQLLRQLHWLPVPNRIDFKIATLTFKTLTTRQPAYLYSLINPHSSSRSLRSSSQHLLSVPRISSATQSKAFSCYAPALWNKLPQSLRSLAFPLDLSLASNSYTASTTWSLTEASNLPSFKRSLKTFLFDLPPKSLVP